MRLAINGTGRGGKPLISSPSVATTYRLDRTDLYPRCARAATSATAARDARDGVSADNCDSIVWKSVCRKESGSKVSSPAAIDDMVSIDDRMSVEINRKMHKILLID